MRVVIEIDEDFYKQTIEHNRLCWEYMGMNEMVKSIKNGIPLDNLRAEIDEIPLSEPIISADGLYCYGSRSISMGHFREKVFEIIDRYKERSE